MITQINTQEIADKLEVEAKEILGYLFENCFSTITPEQFEKLPEHKKLIFQNRIKNLRKLDEIVTKLVHIATWESIYYNDRKQAIAKILQSIT